MQWGKGRCHPEKDHGEISSFLRSSREVCVRAPLSMEVKLNFRMIKRQQAAGAACCCDIYEVSFVGESNPCEFSEGKGNRNQKSILLSKPWRDCKDRFAVTRKLEELISGQDRIRVEKQNFRMDRRQQAAENRCLLRRL